MFAQVREPVCGVPLVVVVREPFARVVRRVEVTELDSTVVQLVPTRPQGSESVTGVPHEQ